MYRNSCIACERVFESIYENLNYDGCEKCVLCDIDFCGFRCIKSCVCCGIETIGTEYCGCETCYNCGNLFCDMECLERNVIQNNDNPEEHNDDYQNDNDYLDNDNQNENPEDDN